MTKTSKKTIKVVCNSNGKLIIKEVEAEKFDEVIIDDKIIKLYIHRNIYNNKRWTITEEESGLFLQDNFKNKIDARKRYDEYIKSKLIDFIKNKYSQYLSLLKILKNIKQ